MPTCVLCWRVPRVSRHIGRLKVDCSGSHKLKSATLCTMINGGKMEIMPHMASGWRRITWEYLFVRLKFRFYSVFWNFNFETPLKDGCFWNCLVPNGWHFYLKARGNQHKKEVEPPNLAKNSANFFAFREFFFSFFCPTELQGCSDCSTKRELK